MARYLAIEPPEGDAEKTIILRDGFVFLAFLLPFAWFLFHRMWMEALLAFGVMLVLSAVGAQPGFEIAASLLSLLFSLAVALEAPALRLWNLRRRGWAEHSVIEADNREDAEARFLAGKAGHVSPAMVQPPFGRYTRHDAPVLGFLDKRSLA